MKRDINYPPGDFAGRTDETIGPLRLDPPDDGAGFSDIFKNSNCRNCHFRDINVISIKHKENGWDANNKTRQNTYKHLQLCAGGGPAVYLKDGFCNNSVDDVLIKTYAKHCDWFEGDYSSTGRAKNTGNKYNSVYRLDGKPVRVRWTFFRAEKPRFTNSKIEYQYFWSFVSTVYVEVKYLFT